MRVYDNSTHELIPSYLLKECGQRVIGQTTFEWVRKIDLIEKFRNKISGEK